MKTIVFSLFIYLFAGCSTLSSKSNFSFVDIESFKPNKADKKAVLDKFGKPDEKELLPLEKSNFKQTMEYWGFKKGQFVRLHLTFSNEKLQSIAYDIDEDDPEFNLQFLMRKLDGRFRIIKEPVRNPHSMPTKCYLVDEKKGISILVNAYKKTPSFVSFWNPVMNKNKKWFDDSTPEFCIAGHCSRVTDPGAWKHNHCQWLEKIVAKNQRLFKKKNVKSKKSSKNNGL